MALSAFALRFNSRLTKNALLRFPTGSVLATLAIPGLWLFGGQDIQVPVRLSMENLDTLKMQGKLYQYQLFPDLGHNTAFAKSNEPLEAAIRWMAALPRLTKRKISRVKD